MALVCAAPLMAQEKAADRAGLPGTAQPQANRAVWVAGVSGGVALQDHSQSSPFAMAWLTRNGRRAYVRVSLTGYNSALQQIDAALPSTFVVGAIGAGGHWHGWVVDAVVLGGTQRFGLVRTDVGERASVAGNSAPYFGASLRGGRILWLGERWSVTPLIGLQWGNTRSLRHRIDFANHRAIDFQLPERAFLASATLRVDYALGAHRQHDIALALTHSASNNGVTTWQVDTTSEGAGASRAIANPDGWHEIAASSAWQVSGSLWLDLQAMRTIDRLAGDATSLSLGLRRKL